MASCSRRGLSALALTLMVLGTGRAFALGPLGSPCVPPGGGPGIVIQYMGNLICSATGGGFGGIPTSFNPIDFFAPFSRPDGGAGAPPNWGDSDPESPRGVAGGLPAGGLGGPIQFSMYSSGGGGFDLSQIQNSGYRASDTA
jgi:hypothetical protein